MQAYHELLNTTFVAITKHWLTLVLILSKPACQPLSRSNKSKNSTPCVPLAYATQKRKSNTFVRSGGFEKSQFLKRQEIKRCLGVFSLRLLGGSSASCGLLGEEGGLDVGQHTSLSDGHSGQQFVQFFVVPDGQLKVAGIDPLLLVVAGCVSRQLQDFGGKVLHHRSEVHGSSRPDTLGVVPLTEKTVNTSNGELKSCAGRTALGLSAGFASFSTSSHSYLLQSTVRSNNSNNNWVTVSRPFVQASRITSHKNIHPIGLGGSVN